ncbi:MULTISPECIES: AbrB/MazE/SpoVT family DNA-binding domain-containing protein [Candidatus Accumulibacter]|jgi:AbrB family looped-hinge helix DNA binding protein|uniref:Transcriptional regulator, AbrB family n=3 Tax=Candidatus Accumulibacter TaxID=327159 RepID=A0A080M5H8_9PROT|nr:MULTISPECIES: AbrB/MazE/SpoVT family DNA-binding domain-containing protein [Candidatus Accumulibacter]KFB66513.1 MAG: transcriptional regulator, AbrB family [Candidatus Accumulibacter vicinus]KFB72324.1 MAG: transcriptional regulator, AbrB family [Candidatus Accumulibacter phosphatis]NMQ05862.1 AbrB/MazE/SpoVT family DNA-binding domain-containing protein [Candidatus Accumulibacter contiguus]
MRITSKGQVTIPVEIRKQAGLMPNTDVEFEFKDGVVRLMPKGGTRGQQLVERLRGAFKGCGMTTDEIMRETRGED